MQSKADAGDDDDLVIEGSVWTQWTVPALQYPWFQFNK